MGQYTSTVQASRVLGASIALLLWANAASSSELDKRQSGDPNAVRWGKPENGLLLGIKAPSSPFIFVPVEGWKGPVLVKEKDSGGDFIGVKPNPGGRWRESAQVRIHVKNGSEQPALWSKDRDVWHVVFGDSTFTVPPAYPYPKPPPLRHGPMRLAAGASTCIDVDVSTAFDVWPLLEPGAYTIQVVYAPNQLLTFARGGEGHYTRPYDVPGFRKGTFVTPAITVDVRHPWLSDADVEANVGARGGSMGTVAGGRSIRLRRVKDNDLRFLSRVPKLKSLSIGEAYVTDAGLAHLRLLDDLERLDLAAPQVSDEGLIHLQGLTKLTTLSLHETQIKGPGLRHLRSLGNLRLLSLHNSPVRSEGLAHLVSLANLRALNLWGTKVTDRGLRHLKDLPCLEQLNLWGTQATDAGLPHLAGMNLRSLSLSGEHITDAGLRCLSQLSMLEELDLAVTAVTDEAVKYLAAIKTLRRLTFEGSGPTDAGLLELRRALPHAKITGP